MRFLVDENPSPRLAVLLTASGHDAVHLRDLGLEGVSDADVMSNAVQGDRVIISADTDFGALLAHSRAAKPSVILVRALVDRRPPELAGILLANLDRLSGHLQAGAIVASPQRKPGSAHSHCSDTRWRRQACRPPPSCP